MNPIQLSNDSLIQLSSGRVLGGGTVTDFIGTHSSQDTGDRGSTDPDLRSICQSARAITTTKKTIATLQPGETINLLEMGGVFQSLSSSNQRYLEIGLYECDIDGDPTNNTPLSVGQFDSTALSTDDRAAVSTTTLTTASVTNITGSVQLYTAGMTGEGDIYLQNHYGSPENGSVDDDGYRDTTFTPTNAVPDPFIDDAPQTAVIPVAWIEYTITAAGSPTVRKLYRHSMPLTGRGMGGKHSSPLIKVRK